MIFQPCSSSMCLFDKTATLPIIFFEAFIIVGVALSLLFLLKIEKRILARFFIVSMGIFIFEFFTHPLWWNYKMGNWAYVYRDVSWLLTIGWAALILVPTIVIDKYLKGLKEWKKFLITLISITLLGLIGETAVVNLGIRSYSPEAQEVIAGLYIPFLNIPWAAFYYIPVFMALIVSFYKYWSLVIDKQLIIPVKNLKLLSSFAISALGVFLFEIMIEAMVTNDRLPSWSYIYRDVSFIMTGGWVAIIWASVFLVDKLFANFNLTAKFASYVIVATIITLPIEAFLIANKFRLYGPSATDNFSGYHIPFTTIPAEVAFAIPFYLSLIVSFIGYWMFVIYNKK